MRNFTLRILLIASVTSLSHFGFAADNTKSCLNLLLSISSSPGVITRSRGNPEQYVSSQMFDSEGTKKVITIARSYSPDKLFKMIPEKYYSINKGDVLQGLMDPFQNVEFDLFHGTNFKSAISIYKSQRFKLTSGVFNSASTSLAGSERFYSLFMKITEPVRAHENTVFKVKLNDDAKVLDLRKNINTGNSSLNLHQAYTEWYIKNLDEIVENYKELSNFKKEMIKNDPDEGESLFDDLVMNVDFFGQLLGADLLMVTRKYGQRDNDEYSLLNPDVISEILPHIGRDPSDLNRVKMIK